MKKSFVPICFLVTLLTYAHTLQSLEGPQINTPPLAKESISKQVNVQAKGKPQEKVKFAFVIGHELTKKASNICLLGEYKRGTQVTLLGKGTSRTCLAKTEETGNYEGEITGHFLFTTVSTTTECGDANLYSLAVLGSKISSYQIVEMEQITDKRKVQSLDKFVRNKKVLEKLRTKAGEAEGYGLSNDLPEVTRYPIPRVETFIVSYKTLLGELDVASGPRAIVINGVVYPLTGWCSYPYMKPFRLDGEYYLESGSNCCECGITIKELFKIRQTGPIVVHSDGSLSD